MVIPVSPDLAAALDTAAKRKGIAPEALALIALQERFLPTASVLQPQDEWEAHLLGLAKECGVTLPDSALGRGALYE